MEVHGIRGESAQSRVGEEHKIEQDHAHLLHLPTVAITVYMWSHVTHSHVQVNKILNLLN